MRTVVLLCAILLFAAASQTKDRRAVMPQPDQFEIGRRTFWDFGPPFNYYDLFVVRPSGNGATVERVILTPAANECLAPAKFEYASASLDVPPAALLESMNPRAIPEQELKRPPKDCKHCARFSGADPSMRVRCGTNTRVIPSRIFEDFWFNHDAKPPKTTFSMLQLLKRLDDAVGLGVMEKPAFSSPDDGDQRTKLPEAEVLQQLGRGEFDNLFKASPDKPSELYLAAQKFPPTPSVRLLESVPYAPEVLVLPKYPPLARAASIEGQVTFTAGLDSNGSLTEVVFVNGHQVLQSAVRESMDSWRFPKEAADQKIHGTIEFFLNCHVH